MENWKHLKSNGMYQALLSGRLEKDGLDGPKQIIYRSMQHGHVWIRPASEFMDGRFELQPELEYVPIHTILNVLGIRNPKSLTMDALRHIYDAGYREGLKAAQDTWGQT